jgi:flagellar biosynthesis GTPase FlhF
MKINILDRMVMALVITTLSLAGISIAADGQREPQEEQKRDQQEKQQEQKQEQKQERVQKKSEQDQKQQQQRVQQQQQQDQKQKQNQQQQERVQRKSEQDQKQQQQRVQQQQQQQDQGQQQKQQQRLSQQQQQRLISQQQQRVVQYRQHLEQQQALAQQNAVLLQQQKRIAQYRFQEQYLDRVRQQQIHLRDDRFDYARDPYFYTAPIYRYNRGGSYYETNEYGAKTLRQAVNYGYEAGFRAGKADRDDRWGSNYKDSYAYRDANYGYSGYYVDRSDYNYYFRQGFRRGYEDGYNSRYQYGRFANGNYSILDTILSQILNFQALR